MPDPEFRKFWFGQTVSLFGTQVTFLALPLTAILVLHATPLQMGILGAVEFIPFVLLTLPAGAWLDRVRRRSVLFAANVARAALISGVPVAAVAGWLSYPLLLLLSFLVGCCAVFFEVAFLAYVPALVGRERLSRSNARIYASVSAAEVGGPGLAGVLISIAGPPLALAADAISYIVSAATLVAIRRPEPPPAVRGCRDLRAEIGEGLRATFGHPLLRPFAFEAATFNLFVNVLNAAFLLFATRELGLQPAVVGLVFAVGALGSLGGSLVAGRLASRLGLGTTIVGAMITACSVYLVIPLVGGTDIIPAAILAVVLAVAGAAIAITVIHVMTIRQLVTPDRLLARMNASYRALGYGMVPFGAFLGGVIGEGVGLRAALLVGALGIASAPLWVVFSPVPGLRHLDDALAVSGPEPTMTRSDSVMPATSEPV